MMFVDAADSESRENLIRQLEQLTPRSHSSSTTTVIPLNY